VHNFPDRCPAMTATNRLGRHYCKSSEEQMFERYHPDVEAYDELCQTGPCFICEIVAGNPDYPAHIVYEDNAAIAFLNKYQTLYGYTLVAPREHREQVTGDFTVEEYLDLQRVIYRVAEAVRQEVGAERVYLLSLGSQQGNRHVHWHIAPLPPGVPYKGQQLAAISWGRKGVLKLSEEERASLATRIRRKIESLNGTWQQLGALGIACCLPTRTARDQASPEANRGAPGSAGGPGQVDSIVNTSGR